MRQIRPVNLEPIDGERALDMFEEFNYKYAKEGCYLRGELVKSIEGMRLVLVFSYDDMG